MNPTNSLATVLFMLLSIGTSCQKSSSEDPNVFENKPVVKPVSGSTVSEASGIAESRINNGFIWVLEDSGNPPQLFLLGTDGNILKSIYIRSAVNRDWEEMAIAKGPDPALDYLYLADIGDNGNSNESCTFYRFPEPSSTIDTVKNYDKIVFRYPDGGHDAEAFLVDDESGDIFILTKRDKSSRVYRLKSGYSTAGVNTAEFVMELPYNGITAAAISPDGKDILVKTYTKIFHYSKTAGLTIPQALGSAPFSAPYNLEPQGEAICFSTDNTGYFTLSEKGIASTVSLYFYRRK
jgi:hypothetical protein